MSGLNGDTKTAFAKKGATHPYFYSYTLYIRRWLNVNSFFRGEDIRFHGLRDDFKKRLKIVYYYRFDIVKKCKMR